MTKKMVAQTFSSWGHSHALVSRLNPHQKVGGEEGESNFTHCEKFVDVNGH